ncbi:MAG: hypothetical protein KAI28_09565 [Sphingomonadales bacterium]|nr:hypothetical protein [Sphingomonadales bacterium]
MKKVEDPTYGMMLALAVPILWRSAAYTILALLFVATFSTLAQLGEYGVVLTSYATLPAWVLTFPLALRGAVNYARGRYKLEVIDRG